MNFKQTLSALGKVDIYIIDQILKKRYATNEKILDAGCAEGRNLKWFYINGFNIYGIDTDKVRLENAKLNYPKSASNFKVGNIDDLPYDNYEFHHILCSAVLHFAEDKKHFFKMFSELVRVLKPNGTLLIRMGSDIGLEGKILYLNESATNRIGTFFLTRGYIKSLLENYAMELIEPVKTTNVEDKRAMTTLVLRKQIVKS